MRSVCPKLEETFMAEITKKRNKLFVYGKGATLSGPGSLRSDLFLDCLDESVLTL